MSLWNWLIAGVASVSLVGQPCPPLSGQTLAGQAIQLPRALAGKPGILILGMRMGARDDSAAWAKWAARTYAQAGQVLPYVVVVVEGPTFLKPLVEAAMRAGADPRAHPDAVTIFDPDKAVRRRLHITDDTFATVLLTDRLGMVSWQTAAGFNARRADALSRAIEGLLK